MKFLAKVNKSNKLPVNDPVGLGIGKFKLAREHPFFIASIYHDGAWDSVTIYEGKQTFDNIKRSMVINNDPEYYYNVVINQYEHLLARINEKLCIDSIDSVLQSYIKYHDESFLDICLKLSRAERSLWLKSQAYFFYFLVCSYRKWRFRKVGN